MNPIGVVATIVVGSLIGLVIISYTYEDSEPPPVHAKTFLQQCAVEEANAYLPIPGDQPGNYGPQEFVVTVKDASSMASLRDFMREAYKCELGSLAIHIMVVPQGGSK